MRICAKMRCNREASATVGISYADRVVVIGELVPVPDPNLLDLCSVHAGRLTPPVGWRVQDERVTVAAALG